MNKIPSDDPGVVELEVVSLGGRSVQPDSLKGACELLDLNVASGFYVEYWESPGNPNSTIEQMFFDRHTVEKYMSAVGQPHIKCGKEHMTIRKRLHSRCVTSGVSAS